MHPTTTTRIGLRRLAVAGSLVAVMLAGSVPAEAAPPERPVMSFDGQITSVTRVGKACSYRAQLAISSTLDGQVIVGTVQAKWKDDCPPPESGSPVGDSYTGKARVRVHTSASGTPDGFRIQGRSVEWIEPLVNVATTAGGTPDGFRFRGVAAVGGGSP